LNIFPLLRQFTTSDIPSFGCPENTFSAARVIKFDRAATSYDDMMVASLFQMAPNYGNKRLIEHISNAYTS